MRDLEAVIEVSPNNDNVRLVIYSRENGRHKQVSEIFEGKIHAVLMELAFRFKDIPTEVMLLDSDSVTVIRRYALTA
jgi:hypothetical protein